jgi:LacI family transcriptional regulator
VAATIAEVAHKAGVSLATASRAMNGQRGVKPETRERVLAAAQALRYAANGAARGLVTARTGTVGYLVHRRRPPEDVYPFYSVIMHGMEAELSRHGHHLLITTVTDDQLADATALALIAENRVDGVVLIGPDFPARFILQLKHLRLPVLLIDNTLAAVPIDSVRNDDRQGGRIATEHLIGHGRRVIAALLGPADWPSSAHRGAGYREALAAAGLEPHPFHGPDTTPETGEALAREAFAARPDLAAIFTANDAMAFGALRALATLGRRVPDDVAVVGFDDVAAAAFCHPPLSTVQVFKRDLGKLAARRVLELITEPGSPATETLLATALVVRGSCGCAPAPAP